MALHYWRPDFAPEQAKLLIADYFEDLKAYSAAQIAQSCADYRRDGSNKFFPTPGQLLGILQASKPDVSHCPIPTYRAPKFLEAPRATKSVAQVLREHGFERAAEGWGRI